MFPVFASIFVLFRSLLIHHRLCTFQVFINSSYRIHLEIRVIKNSTQLLCFLQSDQNVTNYLLNSQNSFALGERKLELAGGFRIKALENIH